MEGVDGSVGTIVWVRRRNGSWWPGRILGQDELSASHLMSPRSGTPVKLLGREDASVDWYNLEKSKRVKAFRCGEFDACIERAEASQGIPIKKREKYARREDAILHALELEKQQIAMKHKELGITSDVMNNKTLGARRREFNSFPSSYDYMMDDEPGVHSKFANHKSQMFSKKAALSHAEEDNLYVHKAAKSKKASSTEHNPEALPRLRGLQDFGLRIAPPKKKFSQSTWETSYKPVNNHVSVHSTAGHMMGSTNHAGGSKTSLTIKRKRSQGAISEDSLLKKRDRRRPLVQVLQSSAQLPVSHSFQSGYDSVAVSTQGEIDHMSTICRAKRGRCVYVPADLNDSLDSGGSPSEQIPAETQFGTGDYLGQSGALAEDDTSSATTEETESDSSETDSSESDTNGNGLRDTTQILLPGSRNCDPPDIHISENFGDLHDDEKSHPGYMPLVHPQDQMMNATADVGVSKWHMKGKRNVRHLPKRPMDPMDGRILFSRANGFVQGTTYENRGGSLKIRTEPFSQKAAGQSLYHKREAYDYAFDGGDILEREGRNHLMGYGNQRYSLTLQADKDHGRSQNSFNDSDSDSHLPSPSLWEADGSSSHMRRAYWDEADECYNPFYAATFSDEMDLIDVDLKVQAATYQGEHVPLVSLMSRLNGKAIIGHPIQIEILEDGSTGHLLAKYDAELDESAPPSAVWKTARRSVMPRVPRSSASASALEGEDNDPLPDSDPEGKPSPKKSYSSYFNHQARLAKKCVSHSRRSSVSGKFQKKPLKSVNLSSQKTRTLSSLANEHRRGYENGGKKHSRQSDLLDGLIRPDGAAPLVTCVPVKVVFSRILEAVNRPSSALAHRVRMANPAVRGPP